MSDRRYGVVREPDGTFTVIDKQAKGGLERYLATHRSRDAAHQHARKLNAQTDRGGGNA